MSTAKFDTLQNAAGSKSVPVATVVDGTAKAWVSFNGTGTVAIRAAFNVTSITDNGLGDYTINFTSALPNASYAYALSQGGTAGIGAVVGHQTVAPTTAALRINCRTDSGNNSNDSAYVNASIFD